MTSVYAAEARSDAKETEKARKEAKAGGDGTTGATPEALEAMTFTHDKQLGVWGNEDKFQRANESFVTFLRTHPVWGREAVEAEHPIKKVAMANIQGSGNKAEHFNAKVWIPHTKTILKQYCKCHEDPNSSRYRSMKMRRNHCMECGYFDYGKTKDIEYEWDEYWDATKGKPALGDVVTQTHKRTHFHLDETHKNAGTLTNLQKIVGKTTALGGHGYIGESYDANLEVRLEETGHPNGEANARKDIRDGSDIGKIAAVKHSQSLKSSKMKTESQLRNIAMSKKQPGSRKIEGMTEKFVWEITDGMPYGASDKPATQVSVVKTKRKKWHIIKITL